MRAEFAVYVGQDHEGVHTGFIAHEKFFAVLEVEGEIEGAAVGASLKKLAARLTAVTTLSAFEHAILSWLKEVNLPTHTSFAGGLVVDQKILLKTSGAGEVYLKRSRDFARLIAGDLSASGHLELEDYFIFATARFSTLVGGEKTLSAFPYDKKPHDLVEEITPELKGGDDIGAVALFLTVREDMHEEEEVEGVMPATAPVSGSEVAHRKEQYSHPREPGFLEKVRGVIGSIRQRGQQVYHTHGQKKTLTAIAVFIIFIVFLWSVALSGVRRQQAQDHKRIQAAASAIQGYLEQATEVATLNMSSSEALLAQARGELQNLKKEMNDRNVSEVAKLEEQIAKREREILKKEDKKEEEFFDLSVEKKDARGDVLYRDGATLGILDRQGSVYLLSLDKKSLDSRQDASMKGASQVALSGTDVFYVRPTSGVVTSPSEGKVQKIIENDQWGKVVSIATFNKNIYLLDQGKDQIYKYTPTEEGYSKKEDYIKSGNVDLGGTTSIAIDGAVYVGGVDTIVKYLAGAPEEFPATFPEKNIAITKIFTSEDVEKVYAWDKSHGAIYVLGKSGIYERQISANVLKTATDFVVFEKDAYVLSGSKIFKVSVD